MQAVPPITTSTIRRTALTRTTTTMALPTQQTIVNSPLTPIKRITTATLRVMLATRTMTTTGEVTRTRSPADQIHWTLQAVPPTPMPTIHRTVLIWTTITTALRIRWITVL